MKSKIQFCIDDIDKKKNGKTIVKGWAFDSKTEETVSISVLGETSEGISFIRENRDDVNEIFEISGNEKYGFIMYFDKKWQNEKTEIMIRTTSSKQAIKLDLSQKVYSKKHR